MSVASGRNEFIRPDIEKYCREHSTPPDDAARELRRITQAQTGSASPMQIGDDQAVLLEILVRAGSVRRALEIGTFTGYSALAIARGMGQSGRLVCCDVSVDWTNVAKEMWAKAGVADRIEVRIGPALETLQELSSTDSFDFVFIDADKPSYPAYFDEVLPLVRRGGLVVFDNTLLGGRVLSDSDSADVAAMRQLNENLARDQRILCLQVPLGDGMTVVTKL